MFNRIINSYMGYRMQWAAALAAGTKPLWGEYGTPQQPEQMHNHVTNGDSPKTKKR